MDSCAANHLGTGQESFVLVFREEELVCAAVGSVVATLQDTD